MLISYSRLLKDRQTFEEQWPKHILNRHLDELLAYIETREKSNVRNVQRKI